ncbi:unnamed protein product [Cylindrotheca closterium]|uniref:Uncharacterized protein n=1 Tax=Cylindrotheca closterium TaxID=2856 RepID=A0AAD2FQL2_9STRA|nr:unnamed protein product [Cylindrotheca closterium]
MFSKLVGRTALSAGVASLAAVAASSSSPLASLSSTTTQCEDANTPTTTTTTSTSTTTPVGPPSITQKRIFKSLRKETTLRHAVDKEEKPSEAQSLYPIRRSNTRRELSKLRSQEKEILRRWELDEDGWRELPARAWPAYQPKPEELEGIESQFNDLGCEDQDGSNTFCQDLLFHISTTLVFYNVNAEKGFAQYEKLANEGHVDSMVACGIMLVEGFGIKPDPSKGIEWLRKAILKGSTQGCYELGTCLYTGIDEVLEEDPEGAFALFEKAALKDHTGALYMVADCLIEGEGTEKSVGKAVPLFYKAAERGHRYSRQRIRELLARKEYQ